ncbi:MAG TPA: TrkA C-terminal domain-containing protein [Desulfatiglandales bacterium]|nr:TrkA C-terminal domain-containing protein [Desulfatiglandales bacterium]
MGSLYFLLPTLLVILFSFLVIRAAAIALMMTGMDEKRAKFQALSAFSGTGFTTKESESVINHPNRRRIITWLMILGNAGIVTVIVTATSSLATSRGYQLSLNIVVLLAGIFLIYKIVTHKGLIRRWESFIEDKFVQSRVFEEGVTEDLLHLIEGYGLVRVIITEKSPIIDSSIAEQKLTKKEILVLGIERGKNWIPIPKATEKIQEGDKLVVYGSLNVLRGIFKI